MKAVIMAGGRGTRIAALSKDLPKPMLPIDGRPILEWEQGFTEVLITVGYLAPAKYIFSEHEAVAKYSARHFDDITRYNAPEKRFAKNAQPAPVRCSSRVWDFPTSILQRKMVFVYTKTLLAANANAF